MKICFPVLNDVGLDSTVFNHFGSAPIFLIIDTETENRSTITNPHTFHRQGACTPFKTLEGVAIDQVVVGNIGIGAMMKFIAMDVRVFRSAAPTVRENLELLAAGRLKEFTLERACPGGKSGCSYH